MQSALPHYNYWHKQSKSSNHIALIRLKYLLISILERRPLLSRASLWQLLPARPREQWWHHQLLNVFVLNKKRHCFPNGGCGPCICTHGSGTAFPTTGQQPLPRTYIFGKRKSRAFLQLSHIVKIRVMRTVQPTRSLPT
jgi:hypothetical protein